VRHSAARRVELEVPAGTPLFFQLDGELREPARATRVDIEIRPAALRVLAAPGGDASAAARTAARAEAV
jgi:diacylglycerol kinase family enzyme